MEDDNGGCGCSALDRALISATSWRGDMERAAELCGQRDDEYPMQAVERYTRSTQEALYRCLDSARLAKAGIARGYMPHVEKQLADIITVCRTTLGLRKEDDAAG